MTRQRLGIGRSGMAVVVNDRDFFRNNPARKHRIRHATREEIRQLEIASGKQLTLPQGDKLFAIVRSITPSCCTRRFVPNSKTAETDTAVDEDLADVLFDMATDDWS